VARTLGFDGVCQNSLDAVSDRDFAIEFSSFASIVMIHVSRMAEEIVLWMNQNFGYVDLSDRYCTGSSIMPQKRNPDVAELARGKSGRVVGHLMALITLMKGQPLTYNKDNQEDKEPLFDTVDTVKDTLRIMAEMVGGEVDAATGARQGGLTCPSPRRWSGRPGAATPPPPTWPTTLCARACRSAMRTRSSRMRSRWASTAARTCRNCRWTCSRASTPASAGTCTTC
jgi:hypothetical protein